jgi:hypothetical protein
MRALVARQRAPWLYFVLAIAVFGFLLRISGVLRGAGPLGTLTSYDDGVYFTSSAALMRGVLPYRDFLLVHPPGITYVLGLVSWIDDPGVGFAAARVFACIIGAGNVVLVGLLAKRVAGPVAAVAAALLYAVHPDTVFLDRSPFIEPFLKFACLSFLLVWLRAQRSSPVLAGVLAAAACALKVWGFLWVFAVLVAAGRDRLRRDGLKFGAAFVLAGLLLVAPLALMAPADFLSQTVGFQLLRPLAGYDLQDRLRDFMEFDRAGLLALGAAGAGAVVLAKQERERVLSVLLVVLLLGFLQGSSYFPSYKSHLIPVIAVLTGVAVQKLVDVWDGRAARALAAAVVAGLVVPWATLLPDVTGAAGIDARTYKQTVPQYVPAGASVFAFDPTWLLQARRLQVIDDQAPVMIDTWGAMLQHSLDTSDRKFDKAYEAFWLTSRNEPLRARLLATDYVLMSFRGPDQFGAADEAWFVSHFECVDPWDGLRCVWRRRAEPRSGLKRFSDAFVTYRDGWYGTDEVLPDTPRGAGDRATLTLPPVDGAGRLELDVQIPRELRRDPMVSVIVDGEVVERFAAARGEALKRVYELPASKAVRELRIVTTETFVPRELGLSTDSNEHGFVLKRLRWAAR